MMNSDSGIGINPIILDEIEKLNIPKFEKDLIKELMLYEKQNYLKGVKMYTDHYLSVLENYIHKSAS